MLLHLGERWIDWMGVEASNRVMCVWWSAIVLSPRVNESFLRKLWCWVAQTCSIFVSLSHFFSLPTTMDLIRSLRDDEVASDELWDLAVSKGTRLLEQMGASPGDVVQSSFVPENDECESYTTMRFRELEVLFGKR